MKKSFTEIVEEDFRRVTEEHAARLEEARKKDAIIMALPECLRAGEFSFSKDRISVSLGDAISFEKLTGIRREMQPFDVPFCVYEDHRGFTHVGPIDKDDLTADVKYVRFENVRGASLDLRDGNGFNSVRMSWFSNVNGVLLEINAEKPFQNTDWPYSLSLRGQRTYSQQGMVISSKYTLGTDAEFLNDYKLVYRGDGDESGNYRILVKDTEKLLSYMENECKKKRERDAESYAREREEFLKRDNGKTLEQMKRLHAILITLPEFSTGVSLEKVAALGYKNIHNSIKREMPEIFDLGIHEVANSLYAITDRKASYVNERVVIEKAREDFQSVCETFDKNGPGYFAPTADIEHSASPTV